MIQINLSGYTSSIKGHPMINIIQFDKMDKRVLFRGKGTEDTKNLPTNVSDGLHF